MADPTWDETNELVPSFDDTDDVDVQDDPNALDYLKSVGKGLGLGAAQGLTFGFADEAEAGVRSLVSDEGYGELLNKIRERYAKAEEDAPIAYGTGEIGSGIATAVLGTPLLGGAKIASLGLKEGIKAAAKTGAKMGALAGAGYSEESLMDKPIELAKDIASSAAMGGVAGAVMEPIGRGISKGVRSLGEFADDTTLMKRLKGSYAIGKETGKPLISEKALSETTAGLKGKKATEFANELLDVDTKLGRQLGDAVETATANGIKVRVDVPELNQMLTNVMNVSDELFENPKAKSMLADVIKGVDIDLTPVDTKFLIGELDNVIGKLKIDPSPRSTTLRNVITSFRKILNTKLNTASPEIEMANARFHDFRKLIPETMISITGGQGKLPKDVFFGTLRNQDVQLRKSMEEMLSGAYGTGRQSLKGKEALGALERNLKDIDADPVMSKLIPKDLVPHVKTAAEKVSAIEAGVGTDPRPGVQKTLFGTLVGTGQSTIQAIANMAGRVAQTEAGETMGKMSKALYNAPSESIQKLSQKLANSSNGAVQRYGQSLLDATIEGNTQKKNAILFTLLQRPDFRDFLRQEDEDEINLEE